MTKQEIIDECKKQYNKPLCLDFIEDALKADTLQDAVDIIVMDSYYWNDSPNL